MENLIVEILSICGTQSQGPKNIDFIDLACKNLMLTIQTI